jgi:hypothetical protein
MLDRGTWLASAQGLEPGRWAKVNHDCGPGRTLRVEHEITGRLWAWCHRCNDGGQFEPPVDRAALARRLQALGRADAQAVGEPPPEPRITNMEDWPRDARLWLLKAGIGGKEAALLGAYYHQPTDRVVIPLDRFWQARAYQPGRVPKYLSPGVRPKDLRVRFGSGSFVVLTEDILSAFKISLAGFEAWPVMGTLVSDAYVAEILRRGVPVITWLDPDKAGQRAARKYIQQLRAYGVPVRNVVSEKDPKRHFIDEIKEYLVC